MNVGTLLFKPSELKNRKMEKWLSTMQVVDHLYILCRYTKLSKNKKIYFLLSIYFIFADSLLDFTYVGCDVLVLSFFLKMRFTTNDYFIQMCFLNHA